MRVIHVGLAWLLVYGGCVAAASAQDLLVPRADLRGLERAAAELAKGGRGDDWRELVSVIAALGLPAKDLATLRAAGERDLARAKQPSKDTARAQKSLREALGLLAKSLPQAPDDDARRHLARQLLALDAELPAANEVLGHELAGQRWAVPGETERARRRAAMQQSLQQARRLEIEILVGESRGDEPDAVTTGAALLAQLLGRPVVSAKTSELIVHSARSATQTERIVRQALRGLALAHSAATGRLQAPDHAPFRLVMLDSRVDYDKAIALALERGWIDAKEAGEAKRLSGFYLKNGVLVDLARMESEAQSALLVALDGERLSTPVLTGGHLNWVCKAFLGTSIPSYAYAEVKVRRNEAGRTTTQDARAIEEREEMFRLAEAGLAGSRTFLRYLAERREDPAWAAAMLPQLGEIQGENLLKATIVAEFLLEEGRLVPLDAALRKVPANLPLPERFAQALGEPLGEFEARWRAWLTGLPDGLVQRLLTTRTDVPRDQQATLAMLNALREQAFAAESAALGSRRPVALDAQLGAGCRAHAAYLEQHPEMAARWPDAHEENPEHADWSADGAWAGGRAVIAPGVKNGEAALRAWMGTFYHRLPLLEPGLLRIGLGQSGDIVVLDSGSMVAFVNEDWHVAWPPAGARDVPTRFVPELPNPVPGEDQARFGYPITLQVGVRTNQSEAEVTMRLLDGTREVPCWFSSPQQPTNAELAPPGAFCLIPKAHLRPGTTYTVVVRFPREHRDLTWSFRT